MDIDLIFKIAGTGIIVAVLSIVLKKAEREERERLERERQEALRLEQERLEREEQERLERERIEREEQERLERYLTYATGGEKYQGLQAQVGWRKSEAVIVDEEKLPKKYMVKKVTFDPDKTAIKKLLKDGIKVKGASLEERQNISIK